MSDGFELEFEDFSNWDGESNVRVERTQHYIRLRIDSEILFSMEKSTAEEMAQAILRMCSAQARPTLDSRLKLLEDWRQTIIRESVRLDERLSNMGTRLWALEQRGKQLK